MIYHFADQSQTCQILEILKAIVFRLKRNSYETRMKHCYVDLSSWHKFWFAIICIDMDVFSNLSTAIAQILETVSMGKHKEYLLLKYNDWK